MPKMIFLNLPVADVEKSVIFYEALGFTRDPRFSNPGMCASMVWSDAITVMILSHDFYRGFVPHKAIADSATTSEMILCLSRDSRAEVDTFVDAAIRAGAKADATPADDYGYMYGRNCEDLDGHLLNAVWMDVDQFLKQQQTSSSRRQRTPDDVPHASLHHRRRRLRAHGAGDGGPCVHVSATDDPCRWPGCPDRGRQGRFESMLDTGDR